MDILVILVARKACFVAGTLVKTEQGFKAIDQLELGDNVLAMNERTLTQAYKPVVKTIETPNKEIYKLVVSNGDAQESIETTENHPFWVTNLGWVQASELNGEDILINAQGQEIRVISLEKH